MTKLLWLGAGVVAILITFYGVATGGVLFILLPFPALLITRWLFA